MSQRTQALLGAQDVTAQLFRYAQDMDALMQQHKRLQAQHQMLLQSLGQEVPGDDLLPRLLDRTAARHWVTDLQGRFLPGTRDALGTTAVATVAEALVDTAQDALRTLLHRLAGRGNNHSAVHWRLQLRHATDPDSGPAQDALLLPQWRDGAVQIHWFLYPAPVGAPDPLQALCACVQGVQSAHGTLLADPHGTILAANTSYSHSSGYSQAELLGNNPRMLSAGRHSASFYQDLWFELLDTGHWSGTLFNRRKHGQIFLKWQSLRMVEDQAGQVLCYLEAMVDLSYAAPAVQQRQALDYTDALTGLPNRRLLTEQLAQCMGEAERTGEALALLAIDLDRFKPINDAWGHAVGDQVLQEVAARMRRTLLPGDLLARVGGDEFMVLLRGARRVQQAQAIGAQLQEALRPALHIQGSQLVLGASMGCARYPLDGRESARLLQQADTAMHAAKRQGLAFRWYAPGLDTAGQPTPEFDLWQALERQEISLLYRPQIRSQGLPSLRGCEAVMRWKHPRKGDVEPTLLLALAEKSGAIVPLGQWALAHACAQVRRWGEQGLPDIILSLKLSLRQLRHPQFLDSVRRALADSGVAAGQLELQLCESQALQFVESDTRPIRALRALGVRIAMDDYGVSFASLLAQDGCDVIQGYTSGHPLAAQDFLAHAAAARVQPP